MHKKYSITVAEAEALAQKIAQSIRGGEVFALTGELGAGKTTFTKHLAKALGYSGPVTSPTFTLLQTYPTTQPKKRPLHIYHFDVYRIDDVDELKTTGLLEHLGKTNAITIIEWADKFPSLLQQADTIIQFTHA